MQSWTSLTLLLLLLSDPQSLLLLNIRSAHSVCLSGLSGRDPALLIHTPTETLNDALTDCEVGASLQTEKFHCTVMHNANINLRYLGSLWVGSYVVTVQGIA